mgnify:CR=1 FL=1|tara:strand:+ start:801 stop:995 length:195 start_codon:yes stop_codon:yes gene_type:complete
MSASKMPNQENNDNLPVVKSAVNNSNKRKRKNSYSEILKNIKESNTEKPLPELVKCVPSKIDKI